MATLRWLAKLLIEYALIVGAFALLLWSRSLLVFLAVVLLLGTRQHALAVLGHDAVHGHAGPLGRALAGLCFWPLGISTGSFRRFHFDHHARVGTLYDPELELRWYGERDRARFGRWLPMLNCIGYSVPAMLRLLRHAKPTSFVDALGPAVFVVVLVVLGPWPVIAAWYIAIYTSFHACAQARAFTEHQGLTTFRKPRPVWWRRIVYLPWGTWLHWEHHQWPGLPVRELARRC